MPKKKLTKTQVKKKLKTMINASYDLMLDKIGHAKSDVPMSLSKAIELHKTLSLQFNRVK